LREIHEQSIVDSVRSMVQEANFNLEEDLLEKIRVAEKVEKSETGRSILQQILKNAEICKNERLAACQDTGVSVVFIQLGEEVRLVGDTISENILVSAINRGVAEGYKEGYLRKSIVRDPIDRVNTGDNTPAMMNIEIVPGDRLRITVMAKGGGCENMSTLKMLTPSQGIEGVKKFVLDTVEVAHANPCPPVIVGVGIGGNFENCALLAKKALLRPIGKPHSNPFYAEFEKEMLEQINKLGIGPQGFGGITTALAVHVEVKPCHIASLPAAVNLDCHSHRQKEVIL